MVGVTRKAVKITPAPAAPSKHPIKAARLLYNTPSYILRGPIYLIFVILFFGILYAFWATKDVLVVAPLALQKDSFTIQATGEGTVSEINVKTNTFVSSGDPVAMIQEQTRPFDDAQRGAFENRQLDLEKELRKVESEYDNSIQQLKYELQDVTGNREARIAELEGQIAILNQQLATSNNAVRVAEAALGIANRQYQTTEQLFSSRDVTVSQRDAALEKLTIMQKAVFDAKARVSETSSQLTTAKFELSKFTDLRQRDKLASELAQREKQRKRDTTKLQEEIDSIEKRLNEAGNQEGVTYVETNAVYTSFFDGVITKVHVARGQIIPAGAPLVTLVRESASLEGHAFVENKDIGHLKRGQEVKIKYFAYPYQEYGIATGLISDIATTPSGPPGKESQYLVKIVLRDENIRKLGGKPKPLEIGLEGVAEIKTGDKRFVEILFSPISKFFAPEEESV